MHCLGALGGIDLLLRDICRGAGMRGNDLAALATERAPALAVLLISGFAQSHEEAARWRVLRKPFRRESLARAMSEALGRQC